MEGRPRAQIQPDFLGTSDAHRRGYWNFENPHDDVAGDVFAFERNPSKLRPDFVLPLSVFRFTYWIRRDFENDWLSFYFFIILFRAGYFIFFRIFRKINYRDEMIFETQEKMKICMHHLKIKISKNSRILISTKIYVRVDYYMK